MHDFVDCICLQIGMLRAAATAAAVQTVQIALVCQFKKQKSAASAGGIVLADSLPMPAYHGV